MTKIENLQYIHSSLINTMLVCKSLNSILLRKVCVCMSCLYLCVSLQARLDVGKAAIMGHSFGGSTTIQALSEDQRFL